MTERKPPPLPPRFEGYRPAEERPDERFDPRYDAYPPAQRSPVPQQQSYAGRPPPQPKRAQTPSRRRSSLVGGLLYGFVTLVALLAGGALVFITSLPADVVRDRIAAEVKARTGRDLVIAGPASFTFYPSIGVTLSEVSLSGPPGVGTKPLVKMAGLDVAVSLLPLLRREVVVQRLVLRNPQFNLEVDRQGRKTWDFAAASGPASLVRVAEAAAPAAPDAEVLTDAAGAPPPKTDLFDRLANLELSDVRIENGAVRYADARSATGQSLDAINVRLSLKSLDSPLAAKGNAVWKAKKVDFGATLTSLKSVLEDQPVKVALTLASDVMDASFDGTAQFSQALDAAGSINGKSSSVRKLARWLGTELPPSKGFGASTAKGSVRFAGGTLSLKSAELTLDGATARGNVTVATAGARPHIAADLKLSELDLNTYMEDGDAPETAPPRPAQSTDAKPAKAKVAPAQSIDDILEREAPAPGAKVKGYTRREGWSEEPIDLASLSLVDADAKLSVGRLLVKKIRIGQSDLTLALKGGVMKTTFAGINAYEGKGTGYVQIDASSPKSASVAADIKLEGISAEPLLTDAADLKWLAGNGKLAFTLAGQGKTQRRIVETLNGKLDFTFADGAVKGINIPGMVRALNQGRIGDLKTAPSEKTDFSELTASWTVAQGIAQNKDLRLVSPLLRLGGSGSVMLPPREIDYTLRPKIVADLAGQGGKVDLAGIEIPVRVHGPWDNPKYTPDLTGALKDPNKVVDKIKELGKKLKGKDANEIVKELKDKGAGDIVNQFKGKKADEIVKGLLGDGEKTSDGSPPPAQQLLEQFLQKQEKAPAQ